MTRSRRTSVRSTAIAAITAVAGLIPDPALAVVPAHEVTPDGVRLTGVGPGNPIIYDND